MITVCLQLLPRATTTTKTERVVVARGRSCKHTAIFDRVVVAALVVPDGAHEFFRSLGRPSAGVGGGAGGGAALLGGVLRGRVVRHHERVLGLQDAFFEFFLERDVALAANHLFEIVIVRLVPIDSSGTSGNSSGSSGNE